MPFEMGGDKFPQFGVRAAAAFVHVRNVKAAHEQCKHAIAAENRRHETALYLIHSAFHSAAGESISQYEATLDATAGDDDDDDDDD